MDTQQFWNLRLKNRWDVQGVGYTSLGKGFNVWMYCIRQSVFTRILRSISGKTACDVGAGTGFYTKLLLKKGFSVTGVDVSEFAIKRLRNTIPAAHFLQGRAKDISGSYDLIVAMDVLFHIIDDQEYMDTVQALSRSLNVNGTLILSENLPSLRVSHAHQVSRTRSEIVSLLNASGLKIRHVFPMFVLMNAPVGGNSFFWRLLVATLVQLPFFGWFLGVILYPIEWMLVRTVNDTRTTKILVCDKKQ